MKFKVGDRVRYSGTGDPFSGVVHHVDDDRPFALVHVRRDDGRRGTGKDGTWTCGAYSNDLRVVPPGREFVRTYYVVESRRPGSGGRLTRKGWFPGSAEDVATYETAAEAREARAKFVCKGDRDRIVKVTVYRRTK